MEVEQVNRVDAERERALLAALDQVFGAPVHVPGGAAVGEVAEMTDLGGDGDLVLRAVPRGHGLADQLFAGLLFAAGAVVGPSRVEVTTAGVECGVDGLDALIVAEVVLDGQRHFAEADGGGAERTEVAVQYHVHLLDGHIVSPSTIRRGRGGYDPGSSERFSIRNVRGFRTISHNRTNRQSPGIPGLSRF